ncbi:MAG TPA: hypothetical protein VKV57_13745 [bacterium]|nr:hypothetical protein [bacterium]
MSTPEERLRKRAAELEQMHKQKMESSAQAAKRDQDTLRQSEQRVRNVAQEYLKRAETLITATRMRVHHYLRYSSTGLQFTLEIGHYPMVQATLGSDGWDVIVRNQGKDLSHHTYRSDQDFLEAKDGLLEPLVDSALEALVSGKEPPAEDP